MTKLPSLPMSRTGVADYIGRYTTAHTRRLHGGRMILRLAWIATTFVPCASIAGCGPYYRTVEITFNSEPPGARVYQGARFFGIAPCTAYWQVPLEQEYLNGGTWTAYWNDGYRQEVQVQVNLAQSCAWSYLFVRPYTPPVISQPPQQQQQQQVIIIPR